MQGGFCAEKPYMDGSGASLLRVPESIQARIKRLFYLPQLYYRHREKSTGVWDRSTVIQERGGDTGGGGIGMAI